MQTSEMVEVAVTALEVVENNILAKLTRLQKQADRLNLALSRNRMTQRELKRMAARDGLSQGQWDSIVIAGTERSKLDAVKLMKDISGLSLMDAKKAVETHFQNYGYKFK